MYQEYDRISRLVLDTIIAEGKCKSQISTSRTAIRMLRDHMLEQSMGYSPEVASEWLETQIRPVTSREVYKRIRFVQFRIALFYAPGANLRELFYRNIQSDYDRLPFWAAEVVDGFISYYSSRQKCISLFRAGASSFLLWAIGKGITCTKEIDHAMCAEYRSMYVSRRGVLVFLKYLDAIGQVRPYVKDAYNHLFHKRIIAIREEGRFKGSCTLEDYRCAQLEVEARLKELNYSKSSISAFSSATNEFGVFLGYNSFSCSRELVEEYIGKYGNEISENCTVVRRSILLVNHILEGRTHEMLPMVFPKKDVMSFPEWAERSALDYIEERLGNGAKSSTIQMDRSALLRFLGYADKRGCRKLEDIDVDVVKGFNLSDHHGSKQSKNAYNIRIRNYIVFLEREEMVRPNLHLSVPSVNSIKNRPAEILSKEDMAELEKFCRIVEEEGNYLESAVIKLAMQTGLRCIDIANLKVDSIDWNSRKISLIQAKTTEFLCLPLATGVCNTLFRYITEKRPQKDSPYLFISPRAPFRHLSPSQLRMICRRALGRKTGMHIIRKTFASMMLFDGVGIDIISNILGHASNSTIDPYLGNHRDRMKMCAIPINGTSPYKGSLL